MIKLNVIANWMQGSGMSGGDRILIELIKRLHSRLDIELFISRDGWEICKREGLGALKRRITVSDRFNKCGYFINYLYRTILGIIGALRLEVKAGQIVYSASDFWPDSIPAFILKLKNRNIKWIASFYLSAPRPWDKASPYRGKKFLVGVIYWLGQLPVYWAIKKYADLVFVTSEPDVEKFLGPERGRDRVMVIHGGVDLRPSTECINSGKMIPPDRRKYDAVFIGRFHYQKGVLELIDIWRLVCTKRPQAKLVMIGFGPLEEKVKAKIRAFNLTDNVDQAGFKDGDEKYEIFKNSKVVVHPATYDSGGMASCEAMAWGLPGVSFDLEALKTYYPYGMLKVPCFGTNLFAETLLELLNNEALYKETGSRARDWAAEWDWDKRAENVFKKISTA